MMRWSIAIATVMALAVPAAGQLVPRGIGSVVSPAGGMIGDVVEELGSNINEMTRQVAALADARLDRLRAVVSRSGRTLEMTQEGPAVRRQILAVDPDPAALAAAHTAGLQIERDEQIEGLDLRSITFSVPAGVSVDRQLALLRKASPGTSFAANHIYFESGRSRATPGGGAALQKGRADGGIGMIDGGVAAHPTLTGSVEQRGFVGGSPAPSAHGTAVASLIAGSGVIKGSAPGTPLLVADVYGNDPVGGNVLAIARALGWLVERKAPVISVSLVGPPNALLERTIKVVQARGVMVLAAVGNDGAASPLSYPASYPGVIAVTAVDRRNKVLIEAGRSLHVDYAAPGANMAAANNAGRWNIVRGTSFAVPLVAGLAWKAGVNRARREQALAQMAVDLGKPGPDPVYGIGLLCGACRNDPKK
ncbi:MAG: S8 family serine peptidase [Sphingobium sp.]